MFFGGSILNVLAFMRTLHLDFVDDTISFLNSHTALLFHFGAEGMYVVLFAL